MTAQLRIWKWERCPRPRAQASCVPVVVSWGDAGWELNLAPRSCMSPSSRWLEWADRQKESRVAVLGPGVLGNGVLRVFVTQINKGWSL